MSNLLKFNLIRFDDELPTQKSLISHLKNVNIFLENLHHVFI